MVYILWMRGVLDGLKIMASFKKIAGLILILSLVSVVNGLLYMLVLSGAVGGVMGVVSLSFYVYYLMIFGVWTIIFCFYMVNMLINVNYKMIVLGVLPLPLFFLKVGGMFALYRVMMISVIVFLR